MEKRSQTKIAKPLVPWVGGKRRLARHILPLFPEHRCYVEPFCGAAALFFMKTPVKTEVLNDINGELMNLYRVVQHHTDELVRQFQWALSSRQVFEWMKAAAPHSLTDIQRAARFYTLQKMAFGGKVEGQSFGTGSVSPPRLNPERLEADMLAVHKRLARVWIEGLDWRECIERYTREHTLFYLDPPYWKTEGYGVPFPLASYADIAALAKTSCANMIISVNDIPEMRAAFKGLRVDKVDIAYLIGGNKDQHKTNELIIRNW